MMKDKKQIDNYGKVLGMANSGMTTDEIANAVRMLKWQVVDILQIGYGRSLMYGRRFREES